MTQLRPTTVGDRVLSAVIRTLGPRRRGGISQPITTQRLEEDGETMLGPTTVVQVVEAPTQTLPEDCGAAEG